MNKKIWEWMCKNTPGALVLYYTARGRTDSDQMKRVLQDIEIKKENKKIKKNLIPLQQPSPTQDAAQPSPKVMPAASKPVPKSAEKSVVKPMPATTIPPISKPITPTPVAEIPSIKLPYLEGSESVSLKRPEAIVFARELLLYDVISFDIFDTLLLRPFAKPTDLFMILGNKYNLMNFSKIRMDSEKEAREIRKVLYNNTEITLEDIYEIVEKKTGIKKEVGIQVEFETEMEFCFANPYIQRVYKLLKSKGKRMIACSDMYIPKEYMQKLLEKCGYTDFEEIYVSCDYNCSKRSKGLYDIVLSKLKKDEKMVHIGDNHTTDILHAEEKGIKTKHYKNVHEAGNKYRADGMSELVGSVYSGIVNTYLHNGIKKYNPYYEFGFIYGGFYVLGFCNWIHKYCKSNNIDKVLFLSRDAYIYREIFNMLYDDVPNEYMYWSRIVNCKYTLDMNKYEFLERLTTHKAAHGVLKITVFSLLKSLDLEELIPILAKYRLHPNEYVTSNNVKMLQEFLCNNWSILQQKYDKEAEQMRILINRYIGNAKNIALVDVGWLGTGSIGLKNLIRQKYKIDCNIKCLLAACTSGAQSNYNINEIQNEEIVPYMFSRNYNRINYDTHCNTNKNVNNVLFELLSQACHPTFGGVSLNNDFIFEISEVENYAFNIEIHKGIIDFALLYTNIFQKYPHLSNISGYDAYLPFRMIIRNLGFIKKFFSDFSFSRSVGSDEENQNIETVEQIFKQLNL